MQSLQSREKQKFDSVEKPEHYAFSKIEVIDAIEAWGLPYHIGNVVKYVVRAGRKDPAKTLEDLKKAQWYLNRYVSIWASKHKLR